MEKRYRFRIYPTEAQELQIQRTFSCARFIYNHYLGKRIEQYEKDKSIYSLFEAAKDLTTLKKTEGYEWLNEADVAALGYAMCDVDNAFKRFFKNVKKGNVAPGFPNFKNGKNSRRSYRCKNRPGRKPGHRHSIEFEGNRVKLPKLRWVKCKASKMIEGRIVSATVLQNPSGKYFVSIHCMDYEPLPFQKTGKTVGLHLGANNLAVTSDNRTFENNKYLKKSRRKLDRLHRRLSRKTGGGSNFEKTRLKLAKAFERVTNQKDDALHKLTTQLVSEYDTICIRNEQIARMMTRRPFGKHLSDANLGDFARKLAYKCEWYGKTLVKADEMFPSVQTCSSCGYKNAKISKRYAAKWDCPECGTRHKRAENAAINNLNEGLRQLANMGDMGGHGRHGVAGVPPAHKNNGAR